MTFDALVARRSMLIGTFFRHDVAGNFEAADRLAPAIERCARLIECRLRDGCTRSDLHSGADE